MSHNYFDPIEPGQNNGADTWNDPLGQLDAVIAEIAGEIDGAHNGHANLNSRLNGLVIADQALQDQIASIIATDGTANAEVAAARNRIPHGDTITDIGDTIEYLAGAIVNVKTLGAVGDGVADDTDFIQEALDYAGSAHGLVYFPPGTYLVGRETSPDVEVGLTVPANRTLFSHGGATILNAADLTWAHPQQPTLRIEGSNVTLRNLRIEGTVINNHGVYISLDDNDIENIHIENCHLFNLNFAIAVRSSFATGRTLKDVWIENCHIEDTINHAISMILSPLIDEAGGASNPYTLANIHIEHNFFEDIAPEESPGGNSGDFEGAIYVSGQVTSCIGFYLIDNTVHRAAPQFLATNPTLGNPRNDWVIKGNTVRQQGVQNIIHMSYTLCSIDNLIFSDNSCYHVEFEHLLIADCRGFKISNCHFESCNEGITISDGVLGDKSWGEITGCTFKDCECPTYSIRNSLFEWIASPMGGTNEYYMRLAGGGDPELQQPSDVYVGTAKIDELTVGTIGSLVAGGWGWGGSGTLGYNTIVVRLSGGGDPDSQAVDYLNAQLKNGNIGIHIKSDGAAVNIVDCHFMKINGLRSQNGISNIYINTDSGERAAFAEVFDTTRYTWTLDASNEYYLRDKNNLDPNVPRPVNVYRIIDDSPLSTASLTAGTLGALNADEWAWGDNNSLGYSTIYVQLDNAGAPGDKEVTAGVAKMGNNITNCHFLGMNQGIEVVGAQNVNYPGYAKVVNCSFRVCNVAIAFSYAIGNIVEACAFQSCNVDVKCNTDTQGMRAYGNTHWYTNPDNKVDGTRGAYLIDNAGDGRVWSIINCQFRNVTQMHVLIDGGTLVPRLRSVIWRDHDIDTASTGAPTGLAVLLGITPLGNYIMQSTANPTSGGPYVQGDILLHSDPAVNEPSIYYWTGTTAAHGVATAGRPSYLTGSGTPVGSVTPSFVGQFYFQSTGNHFWMATTTADTGWKQVTV